MPPRVLILAVLALLLVLGADASAATAKRCRAFVVDGLEVTRVRATGATCTDAGRLARAWVRSEDCNPTTGGPEECSLRRSTCTNTEGPGYALTVVCRRASRRVSFRVGPS